MDNAIVKHIVFYVKPRNFTNLLFFQIFNDKKYVSLFKYFLKMASITVDLRKAFS